MKPAAIAYWVATALVCLGFAAGGLGDFTHAPQMVEAMNHLGYPPYFATILGGWKVLGAIALVAPGLPRLKEWAYAGMIFDLTGAAFSHASMGDGVGAIMTPVALGVLVVVSYLLRPPSRRLSAA